MFCECCVHLHRYQVHLISYGCISFLLIASGLIFTIFSVFQKDTQIGKVWLAGPTTMVVGLVLCGKVVIDWGPAMHQRWDHQNEYEQIPGTNAATSENSNANSMIANNMASLPNTTVLENVSKCTNCNGSQDTLEHKGSSNSTYMHASSSSVSSPPVVPTLSYRVTSRYQSTELQLSMEQDFRNLAATKTPQSTLMSAENRNYLNDDDICICKHLSAMDRQIIQQQRPLTDVDDRSPTASADSSTRTAFAADTHANDVYQGETLIKIFE
uniref:DUF4203 domain-containing protein n=1 Tax=Syphacia muris TaxID=451379 RepID=A0A0N5AXZ3_9BILA